MSIVVLLWYANDAIAMVGVCILIFSALSQYFIGNSKLLFRCQKCETQDLVGEIKDWYCWTSMWNPQLEATLFGAMIEKQKMCRRLLQIHSLCGNNWRVLKQLLSVDRIRPKQTSLIYIKSPHRLVWDRNNDCTYGLNDCIPNIPWYPIVGSQQNALVNVQWFWESWLGDQSYGGQTIEPNRPSDLDVGTL